VIVAVGVLLATTVAAVAETCTLKPKRRETKSATTFDQASYMLWTVQPQYHFVQMIADANGKWRDAGPTQAADAFKRIVHKEPNYASEHPYRGVLKIGTQDFAFALDAVPPPEAKKPEGKTPEKTAENAAEKTPKKTSSLVTAIAEALVEAAGPYQSSAVTAPAQSLPIKDFAYNRLYFDFNHNGDLTDDKVVEISADSLRVARSMPANMSYRPFDFPRLDVAIDVDGTKIDHSFFVNGYVNSAGNYCTVMVSFSSATCREGDITLEGKQHHLVLIDFNSNGRFDDKIKIPDNVRMASGQLYAQLGDVLLVDPQPGLTAGESPYDPTGSDHRHFLSDMLQIDGRWYDLKVSPTGEQLTLTRSEAPMGSVTNKNETFGALIYSGDKGFLKIRGTKDKPVSIPEGEWKLYSYSITRATPKTENKAAEAKPSTESLLEGLAQSLGAAPSVLPSSLVAATATDKYKPVTVRKDETVEMPFGPPYTPKVTAVSYGVANARGQQPVQQTFLEMTLIGVGGEAVTNMLVKGRQPGKPAFTITDPDDKVVQKGNFEYG